MQNSDEIKSALERMGSEAKAAARKLATATTGEKNNWLNAMADAIDANTAFILAENSRDMEAGKANGLSAAMLDRLRLDEKRIKGISDGLRHVVTLPDPVGRRLDDFKRPNGLDIEKVSVPIGVIAIIYESVHRPCHPPRRRTPDPRRRRTGDNAGHQALQGSVSHLR